MFSVAISRHWLGEWWGLRFYSGAHSSVLLLAQSLFFSEALVWHPSGNAQR